MSSSIRLRLVAVVCCLLASVVWLGQIKDAYASSTSPFQLVNTIPNDETVFRVRLSSDGALLVSRTPLEITARHVLDNTLVWTIPDVGNFALSPDGELLVTAGDYRTPQTIHIYRMRDGALLDTLFVPDASLEDLAFTPDGKRLLTVGETQIICWRVANWKRIWTVKGDDDAVRTVVVSPDGQTFATTNQTLDVKLWRVRDAQFLRAFPNQGYGGDLIAYSPDSQFLATGGFDPTVSIWQLSTGQLVAQWEVDLVGPSSLAYRPSGDLLAVGIGDGPITLWHVGDYTLQQTLTGHTNGVNSLVFSPQGQTLYSGGADSLINVWQQIP